MGVPAHHQMALGITDTVDDLPAPRPTELQRTEHLGNAARMTEDGPAVHPLDVDRRRVEPKDEADVLGDRCLTLIRKVEGKRDGGEMGEKTTGY